MQTFTFGNKSFTEDQVLFSRLIRKSYISGYDDSNRPETGFFKKLFYKPTPIYKEADFFVIRYKLTEAEYKKRCGVLHRTDFVCLCANEEAVEATKTLAKKCQNDYSHAPNEKRTRLERSDEFHDLRDLGLVPSLIREPDDDDGLIRDAFTHAHGGNFITYSYLIADFDEFCDTTIFYYPNEEGFPKFKR